jgi:hypothetical protein
LTGWLYGNETKEAWKGEWPTFYLEVKSTSGEGNDPFHMSKAQIDYVRNSNAYSVCGSAYDDIGVAINNP